MIINILSQHPFTTQSTHLSLHRTRAALASGGGLLHGSDRTMVSHLLLSHAINVLLTQSVNVLSNAHILYQYSLEHPLSMYPRASPINIASYTLCQYTLIRPTSTYILTHTSHHTPSSTPTRDLRMQRRVKTLRGAAGSIRCSDAASPSGTYML